MSEFASDDVFLERGGLSFSLTWRFVGVEAFDVDRDGGQDVLGVVTVDDVTTVSTFNFEDLQWTSYSATSSTWLHGMATLGYEGGTNDLADGFTGLLSSNCTIARAGVFTATSLNAPDPQAVDITPGSVTFYAWDETDDGLSATTADSETILDFTLGVVWNVPSIDPPTEAIDVPLGQVDGPTTGLVGRCDCNIRNFVNLGAFIGGDYGDSDSCDECPFAGTYESGALNGVTNSRQCAQVIAVEGNPGVSTEALTWNGVAVSCSGSLTTTRSGYRSRRPG